MERKQGNPEEAAERLAMLLVRLAQERPDVLAAAENFVRALLAAPTALPGPERAADATSADADDSSEIRAPQAQPNASEPDPAPVSADPATIPSEDSTPPAAPRPLAHVSKPIDPNEAMKATASMSALLARFDGRSASGGVAHAISTPPPASAYESDAQRADGVSHLAMVMARHLRRTRRARRSGEDPPTRSEAFVKARAEDWTSTHAATLATLQPAELKLAERWYGLVARAFDEIACWFRGVDSRHFGPAAMTALRDRLACAAVAQKGLYCWIEDRLPVDARRACGVQMSAFAAIRNWALRPEEGGFGVFIAEGMQTGVRIENDRLERLDRALAVLESSHAPEHAATDDSAEQAAAHLQRYESVADAFEAARTQFGGPGARLVFTERAEESAERSPFVRPDEVFEVFKTMHGIAAELAAGTLEGTPLDTVFARRGFRKKPCSKPTMKRHHRFYHMNFEGRTVDLSEHITLGSRNQNTCLSIHWWHDEERCRFAIGHCGKHLPNTMS